MNAGWNLTQSHFHFTVAHCCGGIHSPVFFVWLKCYIYIVAQKFSQQKTDRLDGTFLFLFTDSICVHITFLGPVAHSAQGWQIRAVCLESKSPDIHLLMLWQLVNLFILQEAMEVDRVSWSSCLKFTWLFALSRKLNSSWWAIICGVKVQQVHGPFSWPLTQSCL